MPILSKTYDVFKSLVDVCHLKTFLRFKSSSNYRKVIFRVILEMTSYIILS